MTSRRVLRIAGFTGILLLVGAAGYVAKAWWDSRLPDTYSVMDYGRKDFGGGDESTVHEHGDSSATVSVADLHGPTNGTPDARFELVARSANVQLASGRTVSALTFNGRSPGPELRVRQGDLVEVELTNADVASGITIHWHGVDVPNAEDGVAGVTQDAVLPGDRYTYRFRAEQKGTFWYHTHQVSSKEVRRGLFGAFVIEPSDATGANDVDQTLVAHTFEGVPTLNGSDLLERRAVPPGTRVRLRLVNTDNARRRFALTGTPFRVDALDGTDLRRTVPLRDVAVDVPAGGRADLSFVMPSTPVLLSVDGWTAGLALSVDGKALPEPPGPLETFDPLTYGSPSPLPYTASSEFDRRFELTIDKKPGFFDGRPGMQWALNGGIYPDVPMFHVEEGDLVEVTAANEGNGTHPMHLHGHHLLVLSRNGVPAVGPWWVDTLDIDEGDEYVLAFRANNPGIWMDHCHNLSHAAQGLTMHVAYDAVSTPFLVGGEHGNAPE